VYIASAAYDWLFFLLPPAIAIALAAILGMTHAAEARFWLSGRRVGYVDLASGALIHAHLVAVFFRSHGNAGIFRQHPLRFIAVPPLVIAAMMVSSAVTVVAAVLVVLWDVYHSALQTFGLCRIYDRNAGNDVAIGRRLDWWMNVLLYVGPIVAGATMAAHFDKLSDLDDVGLSFFSAVPAFLDTNQRYVAWGVAAGGTLFVAVYVAAYVRLQRAGYRVVWQKVWLLAVTGLCSILMWTFNPWGQAFVAMNLFHAVQYLALIWKTEGSRVRRVFPLSRAAPLAFLVVVGCYGAWAELTRESERLSWSIAQTVALMHFWYDGFIWSISRSQV
jgi:hypothetical protein